MDIVRGCFASLVGLAILAILTYSGCAAVAGSVVGWRQSDNAVKIAEIQTNGFVEASRNQTDGAVQIAQINADATKKTSWAYVGFYALRGAFAPAGLVWVAVAAVVWRKCHATV